MAVGLQRGKASTPKPEKNEVNRAGSARITALASAGLLGLVPAATEASSVV